MAAQVFWAVFYSSRWPSQIGPTADFDGAAIPPPIFPMNRYMHLQKEFHPVMLGNAPPQLENWTESFRFSFRISEKCAVQNM